LKLITRKPFFNKRNGQITVSIPKSSLPDDLKYSPDLMVKLMAFRVGKKNGN
jgi:hypothetical protein